MQILKSKYVANLCIKCMVKGRVQKMGKVWSFTIPGGFGEGSGKPKLLFWKGIFSVSMS